MQDKAHRRVRNASYGLGAISLVMLLARLVFAANVAPVVFEGDPACADLGLAQVARTDESLPRVKGVTMERAADGSVRWTSTTPIDSAIVAGGSQATVYSYDGALGGHGLQGPPEADLRHVDFCTTE